MDKNENLILTGWGYAEYVASAAVVLKALRGDADVKGMSRRRLPTKLFPLPLATMVKRWKLKL